MLGLGILFITFLLMLISSLFPDEQPFGSEICSLSYEISRTSSIDTKMKCPSATRDWYAEKWLANPKTLYTCEIFETSDLAGIFIRKQVRECKPNE